MDIDLLSKMVKELILDNDRVALPGLGSFVAEIVPSTFSDKGYTINPPYRRLSFRSKPDDGDILVRFYATSNGVSMDVARRIIVDFVKELRSVLHSRKMVIFPGLGRLRATRENNVFFVADENLDIYPDGFGLRPVSLKNHIESKAEVAAAVEGLASILVDNSEMRLEPQSEPVPEPQPISQLEVQIVPQSEPEAEPQLAPEAEPESVPQSEPTPSLDADPPSEPQSEPVPEPLPISQPEVQIVPQSEPEAEPQLAPDAEPESVSQPEPAPAPQESSVQPTLNREPGKKILVAILVVLGATLAVLLLFMILGRLVPELVDKLLYSAEELEILNYQFK